MRLNDAVVGIVLVLFAIAEIVYSTTFPTLHGQAYGSSLFPIIIGCCLIACGLALIVRGFKTRSQSTPSQSTNPMTSSVDLETDTTDSQHWVEWGDWVRDSSRRINMLLVPGLLIAYVWLSDSIGFIPMSVTILTVLLYRLGSSLLSSLSIAICTTVVLQLLFAKVLLVPLPSGLLLRWLG